MGCYRRAKNLSAEKNKQAIQAANAAIAPKTGGHPLKPLPDSQDAQLREEWMDAYIAAGGEYEEVCSSSKKTNDDKQNCLNKIVEAKIVSITFTSNIKVARSKTLVNPPHWEEGVALEDTDAANEGYTSCSKRPATYLFNASEYPLEINLEITKLENVSGMATLKGNWDKLQIESSSFSLNLGKQTISAKIPGFPKSDQKIQWYHGNITWKLEVKEVCQTTLQNNKTLAELFFILEMPINVYQQDKGVWAEVLRFLCQKVQVVGLIEKDKTAEKITRYCHGQHGLRYETTGGAARYDVGGDGGQFSLDDYLKKIHPDANCYDQAAALQALAGAVGVELQWLFLGRPVSSDPFGFIKKTDLLGVGLCNNPFFNGNSTQQVVDPMDTKRTYFGNHAFCELNSEKTSSKATEGAVIGGVAGGVLGGVIGGVVSSKAGDKAATETVVGATIGGSAIGGIAGAAAGGAIGETIVTASLVILDACAGPHTGTEDRQQYLDASIDKNNYLNIQGGTVSQIQEFSGITDVV